MIISMVHGTFETILDGGGGLQCVIVQALDHHQVVLMKRSEESRSLARSMLSPPSSQNSPLRIVGVGGRMNDRQLA